MSNKLNSLTTVLFYEGQPPFALFGIGNYSFAPHKVAISGLHKVPRFRAIGPRDGRPVLFDDTCYFIPCSSTEQAALLMSLLNDPACLNFINSIVFLDSKRPITKKLLSRIDLVALFQLVERQPLFARAKVELERLGGEVDRQEFVWPSIEEVLAQCSLSTVYNNRDEAIQQMGLWVPA